MFPHRDEYTVSQLPGGEGARFAVSGVVCSRDDMNLVHSQPLLLLLHCKCTLHHSLAMYSNAFWHNLRSHTLLSFSAAAAAAVLLCTGPGWLIDWPFERIELLTSTEGRERELFCD